MDRDHRRRAIKNALERRKRLDAPASLYSVHEATRSLKRLRSEAGVLSVEEAPKEGEKGDYIDIPTDIWRLLVEKYTRDAKSTLALMATCRKARSVIAIGALYERREWPTYDIATRALCGDDRARADWVIKTFGMAPSHFAAAAEGGFVDIMMRIAKWKSMQSVAISSRNRIFEDAVWCAVYAGRMNVLEAYDELAKCMGYVWNMRHDAIDVAALTEHLDAAKWVLHKACDGEHGTHLLMSQYAMHTFRFYNTVMENGRFELFKHVVTTYALAWKSWTSCKAILTHIAKGCLSHHRFAVLEYLFALKGAPTLYSVIGIHQLRQIVHDNDVVAIKWLAKEGAVLPHRLLRNTTSAATFKLLAGLRRNRDVLQRAVDAFGQRAHDDEEKSVLKWFKKHYPPKAAGKKKKKA